MKKWNMIVDVANCTNCNVCTLAVQDEHVDNKFPGYAEEMPKHGHRWINIHRKERGTAPVTDVSYLPTMCQHCDDAPCQKAAPDAVIKREDGIVIIDPVKSKGRKEIVDACPYDAVWWNEEKDIPQHWIFDAHLLDQGWKEPRCETVCATAAFKSVKVDDAEMAELVAAEQLETLNSDTDAKPRVYYKNLWRYNSHFIAGSVSAEENGQVDCFDGASVQLSKDGETLETVRSDAYGDFKFDKLVDQGQEFEVTVSANGFHSKTLKTILEGSVNLGDIQLERAG